MRTFTRPDKIEYWFDLDVDTLVLAFHSIAREMDSNRAERVVNLIIEYASWDKLNFKKKYSLIVIKSYRALSKQSLIETLKKNLVNNAIHWRRGR